MYILHLFPNHIILTEKFNRFKEEFGSYNYVFNLSTLTVKNGDDSYRYFSVNNTEKLYDLMGYLADEIYVHGPAKLWNPECLFGVCSPHFHPRRHCNKFVMVE